MTMSEHVPIKSSNIASVAYDPDTKDLEVKFVNGNHYTYEQVAPEHFENIQTHRNYVLDAQP